MGGGPACFPDDGDMSGCLYWEKTFQLHFMIGYMALAGICTVYYLMQRFIPKDSYFAILDPIVNQAVEHPMEHIASRSFSFIDNSMLNPYVEDDDNGSLKQGSNGNFKSSDAITSGSSANL